MAAERGDLTGDNDALAAELAGVKAENKRLKQHAGTPGDQYWCRETLAAEAKLKVIAAELAACQESRERLRRVVLAAQDVCQHNIDWDDPVDEAEWLGLRDDISDCALAGDLTAPDEGEPKTP